MGALNIKVTHVSGRPATGVRVGGEIQGMLGGMVSQVYTNSDGHACISWRSDASALACVYVDGKRHPGPFRSGQTYAFSIR